MSRKNTVVLGTFALALIAVLGIYSFVSYRRLENYRIASKYSALLSFEETVAAVDRMSGTLRKSPYATDGAMCAKICSQVYADAMAAEAAMSALPFSTVELEEMAAYLNQVGDYAYSLCSTAAAEGFTPEDVEKLTELSAISRELSSSLRELQGSVHSGAVLLDSRERQLVNVGLDESRGYVSGEFARFEEEFPHRSGLSYDGKYNKTESEPSSKKLSDTQMLAVAARFAQLSPSQMHLSYQYSGEDNRKCYSAGDMQLCVDSQGVSSMSRSRLVGAPSLSEQEGISAARAFLEKQGFESMSLVDSGMDGGLLRLRFCPVNGDVLLLSRCLKLTVAMDDGSIYSYDRADYSPGKTDADWLITEQQAAESLPAGLSLQECSRVITRTEGGRELAAYRLKCKNEAEEDVYIYVDAASGRQHSILL